MRNDLHKLRYGTLFLCLVCILVAFSGCGLKEEEELPKEETPIFQVETDFEYHYADGDYTADVTMPKVAEGVPSGEEINEQLARYNTKEQLQDAESWAPKNRENSMKRYYSVSNQQGICSLNLFYEQYPVEPESGEYNFTDGMKITSVESWYYNENSKRVLTQETYLRTLGLTETDILDQFLMEYSDRYSDRVFGYSDLVYWFDENEKLCFSTANIDAINFNRGDFDLLIDGMAYPLGSDQAFPGGGKLTDSTDQYSAEVWAGSWWRTETYSNAQVLYSLDPDTKETAVCQISITGADRTDEKLPEIRTLRGAGLGDSRRDILALYPEMEGGSLTGSEEELWIEGEGGYLNLTFVFEGDRVKELRTSVMID